MQTLTVCKSLKFYVWEGVKLWYCCSLAFVFKGNVDIWNLGADTQPLQTYIAPSRNKAPPTICLSMDGSTLCVSHATNLDLLYRNNLGTEFTVVQRLLGSCKVNCHVIF